MPRFLEGDCWRLIRSTKKREERACGEPGEVFVMRRFHCIGSASLPSLAIKVSLCKKCAELVRKAGYTLGKT